MQSDMGFEDPNYVPPIKLSTDPSNFSDYFSEEEYKSSDSIIFTCQIHQLQYDNVDEFEEHQVNEHTVNGRFACGLCEKTYSNKYLRRGHVAGYHLGETYSCSILNCGRKFSQKKYRDQHERTHKVPASENVRYVCDICNSLFDNVDSLKQHKLQHSSSKKFICRYCKVHGYTRSNDRDNHEKECNLKPSVETKKSTSHSSSGKSRKRKQPVKRNLFKPSKGSKGDVTQPDEIFVSESPQGKISKFEKNSNRKQPSRECKNGTEVEGFYKTNTSPQGKSVKSNSSGSATLAVLSPKPAVKGKYKCNFCVQHFSLRDKLLEHVDLLHSNKFKYACSRCRTSFDDEKSFRIHANQHKQDDIRNSKQNKAGNKKRKR